MAVNDTYLPDFQAVDASGGADPTAIFDGSASSTGAVIINELMGNVNATVTIEASNDGGSSWTEVTQLTDADGNTTFSASWHTQFNRVMVETGKRRVVVTNTDSVSGEIAASGDERGT